MKPCLPLCLGALLLLGTSSARADLAPPRPKPLKEGKFAVEVNNRITKAQLIIPRKFLARDRRGAGLSLPTAAVGLCLTLAFVTGGLWLIRRGKAPRGSTAALLVVGLAGLAATYAWADVPPRPRRTPVIPIAADVEVKVVPTGDTIKLVVNNQMLRRLTPAPRGFGRPGSGGRPRPRPGTSSPAPGPGSAPKSSPPPKPDRS
jgi:hypothetical protein